MQKIIPVDAILIPEHATKMFAGVLFDTYQWSQTLYDGRAKTFEMIRRPDTVEALCMVDGQIVLLREQQPHTHSKVTLPGGRVEPTDKTTMEAAQREVQEETGYSFNNWRLVMVAQPHLKIEWFVYTYVAWEVQSQTATHEDGGEKIVQSLATMGALRQYIDDGVLMFPEGRSILDGLNTTEQLLGVPQYSGRIVDR